MTSTSISHAPSTVRADRTSRSAAHWLRVVLTTNAVTSGVVGIVASIAPGAVDELLGTGRDGWIRLIGGVGFVAFAAAVYALARSVPATRARYAPLVSVFDISYVVFCVASVAAGWYSTTGSWVMGATALLVADFAIGQLWFSRRARAA